MVIHNESGYTFSVKCGGAEEVYLVGDFNNWSTTATPMECGEGDVWHASLRLDPGTYRFGYFVINAGWFNTESPLVGPTSVRTDKWHSTVSVPYAN